MPVQFKPKQSATKAAPAHRCNKCNKEARALYLEKLKEGLTRTEAAEAIGIDRTTIWRYRMAHPTFDKLVSQAERGAVELVEDALFQAATKGQNVKAMEIFLYNRAGDRWTDKRTPSIVNNVNGIQGGSFDDLFSWVSESSRDTSESTRGYILRSQKPDGPGKRNKAGKAGPGQASDVTE
jgi:predicted DNA-binding protein (UPF0251 family)